MLAMAREAPPAILDATLRVIAAEGVDAVRYRRVAEAAGVPLGTVSYHFTTREELIRAAFSHFLRRNTESLAQQRARFTGESLDEVAAFLADLVRADFGDPQRRYLAEYELVVYAARDPAIAAALEAWDRARCSELALVLERLGVARPNAAARTAIDVVRGFQLASLGRKPPELEDLRRRLGEVLRALAAAPPAPPAPPARRGTRRGPSSRRR